MLPIALHQILLLFDAHIGKQLLSRLSQTKTDDLLHRIVTGRGQFDFYCRTLHTTNDGGN